MIRVIEEYEIGEEELYSHIGVFLENNANLLTKTTDADAFSHDEEQDSRNDINVSGQRTGGKQTGKRQ